MEPYCQKHNTSNLVFSPRPAAVLSTPAVALRTTPLLCRARSFSALAVFTTTPFFQLTNGSMDQAIRSLVRCDATQLPIKRTTDAGVVVCRNLRAETEIVNHRT
jgi:methylphosphotriester-DNA--protein-cysteine methyltransferase